MGRVRVIFPAAAASSGVRTRSIETRDGDFAMRPNRCTEKTFRREQPIAQRLVGGSGRLIRLSLPDHRAHKEPPSRVPSRIASASPRPRHARSTPPCDNREDSCAEHLASPTMARRGLTSYGKVRLLPALWPRTSTSIATRSPGADHASRQPTVVCSSKQYRAMSLCDDTRAFDVPAVLRKRGDARCRLHQRGSMTPDSLPKAVDTEHLTDALRRSGALW